MPRPGLKSIRGSVSRKKTSTRAVTILSSLATSLTGDRGLRVGRAAGEQVVMVAGSGQRGVQFRRRGRRGAAGESGGGERGRREVRAPAPARPRGVRGGMRVSPRVMRRELAHVCRTQQSSSSLRTAF